MKSFFKKLAFVMAMAMVVSMAAPAAQRAAAAEAVRICYQKTDDEVKSETMVVGQEKVVDLCFKGAPTNWRDYTWGWETSDPTVAVVDKDGVVIPVGAGTATITLVTDCDVTAEPVTVTVTGAAKDVAIGTSKTDTFAEKEIMLGDEEVTDLNFYGVTDWNGGRTYKVQWVSSDRKVAKVDELGRIEPVAPGTTTVTFIGTNTVTHESYVGKVEITVVDPDAVVDYSFTAEQVDMKTIKLTFAEDTDMSEVTKDEFTFLPVGEEGFTGAIEAESIEVDANVVTVTFAEDTLKAGTTLVVDIYGKQNNVVIVEPTVDDSFTVKQTTESKAVVTFANKELTKEDVNRETLVASYYINGIDSDPVDFPIKNVIDIKDGVVTVEFYLAFEDGVTYELTYKEEIQQFVATIGEVARVDFTWATGDKEGVAYVNEEVTLTPVLYNAAEVDITDSALANGGSVIFEFPEGDMDVSGSGNILWFNTAGKVVVVKATYATGEYNDDGTEKPSHAIPGNHIIISTEAPKYTIENGYVDYTIAYESKEVKWNNDAKKFSISDDDGNYKLVVKVKDNNGNEQLTNNNNSDAMKYGHWEFQSSNENILSVGLDGELMPNTTGGAKVLLYYCPNETREGEPARKFICSVPITVFGKREATSIKVTNSENLVLSTSTGTSNHYNERTITLEAQDNLNAPISAPVEIVYNGREKNYPKIYIDGELKSTGDTKTDGKLNVLIVANEEFDNNKATSMTYNYTVKCNNRTTNFTVTVRKPIGNNPSGYVIEFGGDSDIKGKSNASFMAHLVTQYNGVRDKYVTIAGEKPVSLADMAVNGYYYTITKNGNKVTGDSSLGNSVVVNLTGTQSATASSITASASAISYIDKSGSTGEYVVTFYQAIGNNGKVSSYRQVGTSQTFSVKDSRDAMNYVGKENNNYSGNEEDDAILAINVVTDCLKFKYGNTELNSTTWQDHSDILLDVKYNKLSSGTAIYIKQVVFYVPVDADVYEKYEVNVGTSVTLQ